MKRILTSSFFKCLCLESIVHWLMAWCLFGATLFARGYLQPMWSCWTYFRLSEATQNMYEMGGQRNCSKNVNDKRPFSIFFRLLTSPTWSRCLQISPKLCITPCRDYDWLVCTFYTLGSHSGVSVCLGNGQDFCSDEPGRLAAPQLRKWQVGSAARHDRRFVAGYPRRQGEFVYQITRFN